MPNHFTWMPLYQELAKELAGWKNRQQELINFLETLRAENLIISSLTDKNKDGERFLLTEIDPFTFFGVFNRGISDNSRIAILARMKTHFNLQSPVPQDFKGIPILNNMKSWFFSYQITRDVLDVPRLWDVFELALRDEPLANAEFLHAFDEALKVRNTNFNLTMGLFWIRPAVFINLDQRNRDYLKIELPPDGLSSQYYVGTINTIKAKGKSFPEISFEAWQAGIKPPGGEDEPKAELNYWLVGAYWDDKDPADQTERFLNEGVWENGYEDRYIDDVNAMRVGDKIAIKSVSTQRFGLPFDNRDNTVSRMTIKAIGTIVANRNNGRTIEVEWDAKFEAKSWYFYTYRATVWHLNTDSVYNMAEYAKRLIEFVWYGKTQDYEWFCKQWWGQGPGSEKPAAPGGGRGNPPYSIEDITASGVFLTEDELTRIIDRLRSKKAMILQGPPGVGKTFLARKLSYALMEEVDNKRLEMVQFHQSYSYDDFVRGYRPNPEKEGSFGLLDGIFYGFCTKAMEDPDHEYVFIIDEINRGNLSQIFGELLTLIEGDKRGAEFSLPLVYRRKDEARFYIPSNLYLIGLMNVADRSLAMVDYALRRRFAFESLQPQYESDRFRHWLEERNMQKACVDLIVDRMKELNACIKDDPLLGENYQIGHSFFCPKGDNFLGLDKGWYLGIVKSEIAPLLREYWFDNQKKAEERIAKLMA